MMKSIVLAAALAGSSIVAAGCGGNNPSPSGTGDSGPDSEGGMVVVEGGHEGGPDSGHEGGAEAGPDASNDVNNADVGNDVSNDVANDVVNDQSNDVSDALVDQTLPPVEGGGGDASDAAKEGGDSGTDSSGSFTVGGTLTGLAASTTLVLQNNAGNNLSLSGDGNFTFSTSLASGSAYAVTVFTQPAGQVCTVTNGTGTIASANVTGIAVHCAAKTYTVGGTVSGLGDAGAAGLVLQDNGADNLTVNANGTFTFATSIVSGGAYSVTVKTQPAGLACTVTGGSGTVAAANVTGVNVNCANNLFTVGGTVSGLATGASVTLQDNGGNDLTVNANSTFAFAGTVAGGAAYAVTVSVQPSTPSQTCAVANGSGTVSANVTNVAITCTTNSYTVGGTVTGLGTGDSVVLQDNGADNLTVSANGTFTFATAVASGGAYSATVLTSPSSPISQVCTAATNTGTVGGANVTTVAITCTTNTFTVGGTITGLVAGGGNAVVLKDNGGDTTSFTADGTFTFPTAVASGGAYTVTVSGQPTNPPQTCTVSSGTGSVGNANVTSVVVNCSNDYTIGGTVAGLAGGTVILTDANAGTVSVAANGSFTLPNALVAGSTYAVSVETQPTGPTQTCIVTAGSGTASANVTSVAVNCTTNTYTVGGTVAGLTNGESFTIQNSGGPALTISANGNFVFPANVASGVAYNVTVATNPAGPPVWETCTVANATGTVTSSNIQNVQITCMANTYTVGGTLSGLGAGDTLVLQDNAGDNLIITNNGPFTFATSVASNVGYAVTVFQRPTAPISQTCTLTAGTDTGTVTNANITSVVVTCTTNSFTIGGNLVGMDTSAGNSITLLDNGGDAVTLTANGAFTFATSVASDLTYTVTVSAQPLNPAQTCNVSPGTTPTGTVGDGNVTSVVVNCATNSYTIGGSISGLGAGDTVMLTDNGGDTLSVSANGSFTFLTPVASAATYSVAVSQNPTSPISDTCTVTPGTGSGTVTNTNVSSVQVTCTPNKFAIGGMITGLAAGDSVVLNDGVDTTTFNANGAFAFPTKIDSGTAYNVNLTTQPDPANGTGPTQQVCTLTMDTGTVGNADVTTVQVTCVTTQYSVSVQVNGLVTSPTATSIDVQNNGGNDIVFTGNNTAVFTTLVNNNSPYAVTLASQPANTLLQSQRCNVVSGTGTMPTHNITVQVYCGRDCLSIHNADPTKGDGEYLIDPDGSGPITQFNAYCVMLYDGGGFTLIESTNAGKGPSQCTAGAVTQNSCTFLPTGTAEAVANLSTQIHVRAPVAAGVDPPVNYIESIAPTSASPDSLVIQNLRLGNLLNMPPIVPLGNTPVEVGQWPTVVNNGASTDEPTAGIFPYSCIGGPPNTIWPSIYWACNNGNGFHLLGTTSKWDLSGAGGNLSLEVYAR